MGGVRRPKRQYTCHAGTMKTPRHTNRQPLTAIAMRAEFEPLKGETSTSRRRMERMMLPSYMGDILQMSENFAPLHHWFTMSIMSGASF